MRKNRMIKFFKNIIRRRIENSEFVIKNSKSAFTLVEILLYTAIASILILSISTLAFSLIQARDRGQVLIEVEENGTQIMNQMTQVIRNAVSITTPTIGTTGTSLTIVVDNGTLSPTVYDLSSGAIRIKEGVGATVNLTSNRVTASNLQFINLSNTGTKGSIQIKYTLTYVNTSGKSEFTYAKDFVGTATLK